MKGPQSQTNPATGCWAAPLGGCSGPITKEHFFTEALFKKKITISGIYAMPNGACPEWLTKQGLDMSIKNLTANILCEQHNRLLGKTADRAAIDLQNALMASLEPMKQPGSKIMRPPISRIVCGVHYAQWLCKTHCNIMAADGIVPNRDYVRYAFGFRTENRLHFYTLAKVRQNMQIGRGRISYTVYVDADKPNVRIFEITLAGLRTLVTTFPVDSKKTARLMHSDASLLDRLKCVEKPTPLGYYKIHFDWCDEPSTITSPEDNAPQ